jgi:hypothetical protein
MNKMEITNHGRGLALTMGLASMHVCVLLGFVEGLCAEIDGFNACVMLEFIERLYAVIDGFQCVCSAGILLKDYVLKLMVSMCVFCWNLVTVYMLGLLQHVWCVFMPKCVLCSEIVIRCRNCVGCSESAFAAETELSTVNL